MKRIISKKRSFVLLCALLVLLVLLTRMVCITHEIKNHPDEFVFVHSSVSMTNVLLGVEEQYSEIKPYPQGSYFFYVPFQLLASLIGRDFTGAIANRIGAVCYFTIGALAGLTFTRRYFKSRIASWIYVLICVFSIFHIEQSRYGTGDAVTFALLMLGMYCSARGVETGKAIYIYLSFTLVGFTAAVKYPLMYFVLMPACAAVQATRKKPLRRILYLISGLLVMLAGFLLLSPGVVKDIGYLKAVIMRETDAYMQSGTAIESSGGVLNNFLSVCVYWFLYSDILFSPFFFTAGLIRFRKDSGEERKSASTAFITITMPVVLGGFLLYNLFISLLFMRTLYPFFVIILPYVAYGCSLLFRKRRVVAVLLVAVLVVRGCMLTVALVPASRRGHMEECLRRANEISGGKRTVSLATDFFFTGGKIKWAEEAEDVLVLKQNELILEGFPEFRGGDTIVTGALEYAMAGSHIVPIDDKYFIRLIDDWQKIKENHAGHYVGQAYPQYYGWLYGLWVKGSTLSQYDFPVNYVYAIPPEE